MFERIDTFLYDLMRKSKKKMGDRTTIPDKGKSAFTGVCWNKEKKKWLAKIRKDGKSSHLGYFDDEEEAARKYDEAAATLGRPLNFETCASSEPSTAKETKVGYSTKKGQTGYLRLKF